MNDNEKPSFDDSRLIAAIWIALMAAALLLRPLLPIDETRYLTVAWEMYLSGEFLVPHLNGELYSHKPPLLFWLMNLGWAVFGVVEAWARMVAPLFGLGALALTAALARQLWPEATADTHRTRAAIAPLMLLSGVYWAVFSTLTMFDMMLTFSALVGLLGVVKAWRALAAGGNGFWKAIALTGLGLGLGGLSKGPAILLHVLPVFVLAPLWGPRLTGLATKARWGLWYGGLLVSILIGFALALAWAIPAAIHGGPEYSDAIFLGQSTGRMVNSFAHNRPFWWFVPLIPVMVLPWSLWPRVWKSIGARQAWTENRGLRSAWTDGGVRVLLVWFGVAFVAFSAISGKQPHYLLPEFPALALLVAYLLTQKDASQPHPGGRGHRIPVLVLAGLAALIAGTDLVLMVIGPYLKAIPAWADAAQPLWMIPAAVLSLAAAFTRATSTRAEARMIAMSAASVIVFLHMAASPGLNLAFNLGPSAQKVAEWQAQDRPVAYLGKYHGEFQFLGRLETPLTQVTTPQAARAWAADHLTGIVIDNTRLDATAEHAVSVSVYRGKYLVMWEAEAYLEATKP